jgi:glutaredoxin-like protein
MYLSEAERASVASQLSGLTAPVTLRFFEQSIGCDLCAPARRLLEQIAELNDRISLDVLNLVLDKEKAQLWSVDRVPAIVVESPGRDRIRFFGAPFGNELMSLIDAIRMTSTGESGLSEESRSRLEALAAPVDVKVFFTPTCVYCPRMVGLANRIAVASPFVVATAIDATEYPDLARRFNVNGVPKTVINDKDEIMGAVPENELLAAIC